MRTDTLAAPIRERVDVGYSEQRQVFGNEQRVGRQAGDLRTDDRND
jgi:hypothetical protein